MSNATSEVLAKYFQRLYFGPEPFNKGSSLKPLVSGKCRFPLLRQRWKRALAQFIPNHKMNDPTPQGDDASADPVTEATQGEPTETPQEPTVEPVTEPKPEETPEPKKVSDEKATQPPMTQSEWQDHQERLKNLEDDNAAKFLEEFESNNPIVKTEKYKDKWNEALKKRVKGGDYEKLSLDEVLNIIRDPQAITEVSEETAQPPIPTVPSINPSVAPVETEGEVSQDGRELLKNRYTDEEIDNAGTPAE